MLGDFPKPVTAGAVRAAGLGGVLRYWPKQGGSDIVVGLTAGEIQDLLTGGVPFATIYEELSATWMAGGFPAGQQAGTWLAQQFAATNHTPRCVYLTADSNTLSSAAVNACLDGAASVLGRDILGLYAYAPQLAAAQSGGHATRFWLTGHYAPLPWMHLYQCNGSQPPQYPTLVSVGGQTGDGDIDLQSDWGQTGGTVTDPVDLNLQGFVWKGGPSVDAINAMADLAPNGVDPKSLFGRIVDVQLALTADLPKLDQILAAISALSGALSTDEAAILAAVQGTDSDVKAGVAQLATAIAALPTGQPPTDAQMAALTAAVVKALPGYTVNITPTAA